MVLIMVMVISIVVIMMTAAVLSLSKTDLFHGGHYRDRVKALELARGALNHAVEVLSRDPGYMGPIAYDDGNSSYLIKFTGPTEERSINNLVNIAPSAETNFRGDPVAGYAADLYCTAGSGRAKVRVRALIKRGFGGTSAVSSTGRVILENDVVLDGIRSLHDPTSFGGGITSTHSTAGPGDEAIVWHGGGMFSAEGQTELKSGPSSAQDSISANLKALFPGKIREGGASEPPPEFDVTKTVMAKSALPAPDGMTSGAVNILNYPSISDERHVSGSLEVTGDLKLSGGTLYVDGDLTLNGGFHGVGSVFVKGNVTVNGGNSVLMTNQSKGAALFASGDVTMEGIDASGYLDALGSSHPSIATAKQQLTNALTSIKAEANSPINGANAHDLWARTRELAWDQPDLSNYWLSPIPSPDGSHALGSQTSPLPATITAIKSSLGANYQLDTKAQKIVRALEQTHHNLRFNYFKAPAGTVVDTDTYMIPGVDASAFHSSVKVTGWDDNPLLAVLPGSDFDAWSPSVTTANGARFLDLTLDHQWRASGADQNGLPTHLQALRETMFHQIKAFIDYHPLDFGWLGNSYFQGLVYAGGNVEISNKFRVVGALLSQGDVHLSGGSELIFNSQYMNYDGAVGPVYVASYEEL